MIEARVICDSISPAGIRLTTMQLRYPKFIHGEFMTHRVFSRNASSSRAVPTAKLIEEVRSDALRAGPVFWGKNQPGMQAAEELSNDVGSRGQAVPPEGKFGPLQPAPEFSAKQEAHVLWNGAAMEAAEYAERMMTIGAHKQIVNRILEPFLHINVVVTATEWANFFGLRLHKDAQPEMRALAEAMWKAQHNWNPTPLHAGQWHLPYTEDPDERFKDQDTMIRVSVARCARVSYTSFETGRRSTVEEDLKLYDRLVGAQPMHASPAEHQATPDQTNMKFVGVRGLYLDQQSYANRVWNWLHPDQHGNFVGWRQYRKMLPNEHHCIVAGGLLNELWTTAR